MDDHKEECGCCFGTGILLDIELNESACMTCSGKGYFAWTDDKPLCAGCTENEAKPGESLCEQCDRVTMRQKQTPTSNGTKERQND